MSTLYLVSSKKQAREQPLNEFLFKILNSFDLEEFKKFSNFPQLLEETIKEIMGSDADPYTLDDRIQYHFETNVSNIDKWRSGLFNQVELTAEFYGSNAAKRIFEDAFGIKECVVRLVLPTESRNVADFDEWLKKLTSSAIFRTENFHYPIIGLIPPTTFRDGTIQRKTDRCLESLRFNVFRGKKIGPKSRTRHRFFMSSSSNESSDGSVLTRNMSSSSEESSYDSVLKRHGFFIPSSSEESSDSFNEPDVLLPSNNVFKMPKPKIGPKSRISQLKSSTGDTNRKTPESLHAAAVDQPERSQDHSSKVIDPRIKPRIGPFVMLNRQQVQLSLNELPAKSPRTVHVQSIEPTVTTSENIIVPVPKLKIESKFQVNIEAPPLQYSDAIELNNNINRSIERAQQHSKKYFGETDRNVQSIKHFWVDFFRSEFEEVETLNGLKIEPQALVVDPHPIRCAEHSDVHLKTKIKVESVEYNNNETYSSDVQIIELPPEEPIEISDDETQLLFDQLQVGRNDTEDLVEPIEFPQSTSSKKLSTVASTSKESLNIAVEPVQNNPSVDCQDVLQQRLPHPSNGNIQIEERTTTESQHQWHTSISSHTSWH